MKSVVAFANVTGGKIIFGTADKTREVVGFDKEDVFKKMDAIRELIINAMVLMALKCHLIRNRRR